MKNFIYKIDEMLEKIFELDNNECIVVELVDKDKFLIDIFIEQKDNEYEMAIYQDDYMVDYEKGRIIDVACKLKEELSFMTTREITVKFDNYDLQKIHTEFELAVVRYTYENIIENIVH